MLTLTRKTDYALIALSHLAANEGRVVSAREIASKYKVPLALLMNLLKLCAGHGLVESVRGARGGYRLGKPADKITLVQLVEAIEGPLRLSQCRGLGEPAGDKQPGEKEPSSCQVGSCCPVRVAINNVHMRLQGFLSEMTIAEVAQMAVQATAKVLEPHGIVSVGLLTEEPANEAADLPGQ
jgi:Rrf2 family protein